MRLDSQVDLSRVMRSRRENKAEAVCLPWSCAAGVAGSDWGLSQGHGTGL